MTKRDRADRIAELESALRAIVQNFELLSGYRAHALGCECGGTNDGVHSCRSMLTAIKNGSEVLDR